MIEIPTLALSLWPEWTPAFHKLGKDIENRPRAPWASLSPTMHGPGPWLGMHAGAEIGGAKPKGITRAEHVRLALRAVAYTARDAGWTLGSNGAGSYLIYRRDVPHSVYIQTAAGIVRSALTGIFRIVEVVPPGVGGPWRFPAQYGYRVEYRHLVEPVPCSGAQGFWRIPADVRDRIRIAA